MLFREPVLGRFRRVQLVRDAEIVRRLLQFIIRSFESALACGLPDERGIKSVLNKAQLARELGKSQDIRETDLFAVDFQCGVLAQVRHVTRYPLRLDKRTTL